MRGPGPIPTLGRHVREATEPDEPVGSVEVLELSEDADAHRLLRLDELALEEGDQRVPLTRVKGVLPELDDGTGNHLRTVPILGIVFQAR